MDHQSSALLAEEVANPNGQVAGVTNLLVESEAIASATCIPLPDFKALSAPPVPDHSLARRLSPIIPLFHVPEEFHSGQIAQRLS